MTATAQGGDCFPVAAGFARSELPRVLCAQARVPYRKDELGLFRIVHGLPVGTSGDVEGHRYWHAWVEIATTDAGIYVLDNSNGKHERLPRGIFYGAADLDESHVWRFTLAEAERHLRGFGHCGPWVPGWERMGNGPDA